MECVIDGSNIKPLAKAIQVLARIGDDLYIEALQNDLVFRTVNSSRSAYVCINFKSDFFVEYNSTSEVKCKISLKSCLMAFRSLPTMERSVETCLLNLGKLDCILLVQFKCRHDMMKVYHLPFIENEVVNAAFKDQAFQCKLTAQSRLLIDGIQNFSNSVIEVTLNVCTNKVILKNHIEEDVDKDKVVHTELMLQSDEFEYYELEEQVEVTFCLKELRAVMNFSEGFSVPVTINCQEGGKPIMFSIDEIPGVKAVFVMATLADKDVPTVPSQSVGRRLEMSSNLIKLAARTEKKGHSRNNKHKRSRYSSAGATGDNNQAETTVVASCSRQDQDAPGPCSNHSSIVPPTPKGDSEESDDEAIPATPPQKKFRYEFLGLSKSSQYTSMAPDPDEILAEASDDDYD